MSRGTLLIADADARSLRILELALRKAGYAVETAADGTEALQRACAADLVVCEAALPAMDGLSLCRALRAQPELAGLPIVIISADLSLAARALEAGADEFLRKPFMLRELVQRVRSLLERRELLQAGGEAVFSGSMRDLGLVDALQSLLAARKSAVVSCESYGRTARVWLRDGELVDAELGALTGDAALARLLTWESGSFKAAPAEVDRKPCIAGGTEAALAEAMRQVEELGRASDELAMTAILAVDYDQLAEHLETLPDEVNGVLRNFDGRRSLREAIDLSPVDDLATLEVVRRLLGDGILRPAEPVAKVEKPSLEQWLSNPPAEERALDPVMRPRGTPIEIVRFPPLRGTRRERLRREAEAAAPIAPVAPITPAPPPPEPAAIVPGTPPPQLDAAMLKALQPPKRPWRLYLAAAAALLVGAWLVRPQLRKAVADVSAAQAHRAVPAAATAAKPATIDKAAQMVGALAPHRIESQHAAAQAEPPAPASDRLYAKALEQGEAQLQRGKYRSAIAHFQRAVKEKPQAVPALLALGDALLEADKPADAVAPLETAARLDGQSGRAQLLLGTAYQGLGRNADAYKAYQRYLELEPNGEFARDVRSILANLSR